MTDAVLPERDQSERGAPHPVLRVLRDRLSSGSVPGRRHDGHRLVLAIEGGGNRGAISGGMALALYDAGLLPAFDAVYGSSAGALTGAWLLSSDPHVGIGAWADPRALLPYSRLSNLLRRRPVVDLERLVEELYDRELKLDPQSILDNSVSFHPMATDVHTGRAVDLAPMVTDRGTLHLALRASAALPILAGKPVALTASGYLDAGLAESVPFETPIAGGATHMLVLRSRKEGELSSDGGLSRRLTAAWLGRYGTGIREAFLARERRAAELDLRLIRHQVDHELRPAVLSVRPAAGTPRVSRLESDPAVIAAALEAGKHALRSALEGTVLSSGSHLG
jgi:predicted patatin/cPLA2 family phospholipase